MSLVVFWLSILIPVVVVCGPVFYLCYKYKINVFFPFFAVCVPILAFLLPIGIPAISLALDKILPGANVPHDIGLVAWGLFVSPFVAAGSLIFCVIAVCIVCFVNWIKERS